jgi:hypothetical protein
MKCCCSDFPVEGLETFVCDTEFAVSLHKDSKLSQLVKHIDLINILALEDVADGEARFVHLFSEDVSDCLTNALPCLLFEVGLVCIRMQYVV